MALFLECFDQEVSIATGAGHPWPVPVFFFAASSKVCQAFMIRYILQRLVDEGAAPIGGID
ncbi:hypothetical protein ACCT04_35470, partial [Rhizobium ruizarguesonis]